MPTYYYKTICLLLNEAAPANETEEKYAFYCCDAVPLTDGQIKERVNRKIIKSRDLLISEFISIEAIEETEFNDFLLKIASDD